MRSKSPTGSPPAWICRWGKVFIAATIVAVPIVGCVYDSSKRCGPGQTVSTENQGLEVCVCDKGYAYSPSGCVACGPNQVAGATGCVCAPGFGRTDPTAACVACGANEATSATGACECASGFSRPTPTEACAKNPEGLGVACDATKTCSDAKFNFCHTEATATAGYCTNKGCTSQADCTGGYACDTSAATPYCRRPPAGANKACASDADCAGTDATYCDTFFSKVCLVKGCTMSPDNCFTGTSCCDIGVYVPGLTLCLPPGACTT